MTTRRQAHELKLQRDWKCTYSQLWTLSYIGKHRKTSVRPKSKSCPDKVKRNYKRLLDLGWLMWVGDYVILTYEGERRWAQLHPYSKYAVRTNR